MEFWISGEVMADVDASFQAAQKDVESHLNQRMGQKELGSVKRVAFIAIISTLPERWFKEITKYHESERKAEFRLRIDHVAFLAADGLGKRRLLCAALERAINLLPEVVSQTVNHDAFLQDFRSVISEKGWESPATIH